MSVVRRMSKLYIGGYGSGHGCSPEDDRFDCFLCVTISHSHGKNAPSRPEECFIPFKQENAGLWVCGLVSVVVSSTNLAAGSWKQIEASPEHVARMKTIWVASLDRAKTVEPTFVPPLPVGDHDQVSVTTDLGLPLCRAFAHASGGWLAIDSSRNPGRTHFWCVLESPNGCSGSTLETVPIQRPSQRCVASALGCRPGLSKGKQPFNRGSDC